jgi:hypothetical protein
MDGSTEHGTDAIEGASEEEVEEPQADARPDIAPEVPEADAIEQSQSVTDEEPLPSERLTEVAPEVPEADAIEQSIEVPDDAEERR